MFYLGSVSTVQDEKHSLLTVERRSLVSFIIKISNKEHRTCLRKFMKESPEMAIDNYVALTGITPPMSKESIIEQMLECVEFTDD